MHYVVPPLELSLKGEPAGSHIVTEGNLHMEADGIQRTAGKAVSVVGKFLLQLFACHGSPHDINAPSGPFDGSLFGKSEDDIANFFVFKAGLRLQL